MKNYNCEYSREGKKLDIGDNWYKTIEADNPREAYEKFIKDVGVFQKPVIVDGRSFFKGPELFSDHIEAAVQGIHEKEKTEVGQSDFQGTNRLEDPEIQYQDARGKTSNQTISDARDELMLERLTSIDKTLNMIKWPVYLACLFLFRELWLSQFPN